MADVAVKPKPGHMHIQGEVICGKTGRVKQKFAGNIPVSQKPAEADPDEGKTHDTRAR